MASATFKKMAYGINASQVTGYATFRLERGFLFTRAGNPVVAIPQFKGVQIVSHTITATTAAPSTPTQTALKSFTNPTTTTTFQWPNLRR